MLTQAKNVTLTAAAVLLLLPALSGAAGFCPIDCTPLPKFSINDVTVNESAGNAIFTVSLSEANTASVTVNTVAGTALSGSDFVAVSTTLNFTTGLTQTVSVPIVNDTINEPTENFTVVLSNATGATIAQGTGLGTITDDDAPPPPPPTTGISISGNFPRSNVLVSDTQIDQTTATIKVGTRQQYSETGYTTGFLFPYFRLDGVLNKRPLIRVHYGTLGYDYRGKEWPSGRKMMFSYNNVDWQYINFTGISGDRVWLDSQHSTSFTGDTVYFAWGVPYTNQMVADYIASIAASPYVYMPPSSIGKNFVISMSQQQTAENGMIIPPQPYHSFVITDPTQNPVDGLGKRTVLLLSGVHAAEDIGNWALQGALDFLLSNDAKAISARQNFRFLVYPLVNPSGRYGGHRRGAFEAINSTYDPNRHFHQVGAMELLDVVKNAAKLDTGGTVCTAKVGLDFHGDVARTYLSYGNGDSFYTDWSATIKAYQPALIAATHATTGVSDQYFREQCGAKYAFTIETGSPYNISQAAIATWGAANIRALVDLFAAGKL